MNFLSLFDKWILSLSPAHRRHLFLVSAIVFLMIIAGWEYYQNFEYSHELRELRHSYQLLNQEFKILLKTCASKH